MKRTPPYPAAAGQRSRWILSHRPAHEPARPDYPRAVFTELERDAAGRVVPGVVVILSARECPWKCLMCDLWRHSLPGPTPPGAIPAQLDRAHAALAGHNPAPRQIKLYNGGSFFDPLAVPPGDWPAIAERVRRYQWVVVECHPALVGDSARRFRDQIAPAQLEVALGLETVHPRVLPQLNKRMTRDGFARAVQKLTAEAIATRAFILVKPPFLGSDDAVEWALRSLQFAFDAGVSTGILIPTRAGNGALEALAAQGRFSPPSLAELETALARGIALGQGRIFADLWDLERLAACPACFPARHERLEQMNLRQQVLPPVSCPACPAAPG